MKTRSDTDETGAPKESVATGAGKTTRWRPTVLAVSAMASAVVLGTAIGIAEDNPELAAGLAQALLVGLVALSRDVVALDRRGDEPQN